MTQDILTFSIIIPTYNRPKELYNCLKQLEQINYRNDTFEIIIVDDGSKLSLDSIVNNFNKRVDISLFKQINQGPAVARNNGAQKARGKFLAFIDDDCLANKDWLNFMEDSLNKYPKSLVGGKTLNALEDNPFSTTSQILIDYIYSTYDRQKSMPKFFTSNNMALTREMFLSVNGFNSNFRLAAGEDREFCEKLLSRGYNLLYEPQAIIYHEHNLNFKSFCKQHFNYGRGRVVFNKIYRQRTSVNLSYSSLFFYIQLLKYPFSQDLKYPSFLIFLILIISQISTLLGIIKETCLTK
jgi:glycosyltransferase involved in cell wall biosynthesis